MNQQEDMRDWLEGALEQGTTRLELRAKLDDKRVRGWNLAGPGTAANDTGGSSERLARIAQEVIAAATRDGRAQPASRVVYVLFACGPEEDEYLDRFFLQVEGRSTKGRLSGEEDEPATLAGLTSQMMRQNAELHRLLISAQEGRAEADERMNERLMKRVEEHEDKRAMLLATWEELALMQADREKARREADIVEKRHEYLKTKLDMVLPVVLNAVATRGRLGAPAFFGEEMLRQLLNSLSQEQVDAIQQGSLPPLDDDQKMLLFTLYQAFGSKERHKEEQERTASGRPSASGAPGPEGETP